VRLLSLVVKKTEQMLKIKLRPLVVLYLAKNIEFSHNKVMHGDMRKCKRYFVIRTITASNPVRLLLMMGRGDEKAKRTGEQSHHFTMREVNRIK